MKHYKPVEFLPIFSVKPTRTNPKPPTGMQRHHGENFVVTVLAVLVGRKSFYNQFCFSRKMLGTRFGSVGTRFL